MSTAPRDGSLVRLFGKWAPPDGVVCKWRTLSELGFPADTAIGNEVGGGWLSREGLAVFAWQGWLPEQNTQ